jgi:hypothetical protein
VPSVKKSKRRDKGDGRTPLVSENRHSQGDNVKAQVRYRLIVYAVVIVAIARFVPAPAKWIGVGGGLLAIAATLIIAARVRRT